MGTIDIQTQGDAWVAYLDDLIARRRIIAIKIFPGHDPIYPTDPRLAPVYAMCQRRQVPMVIHTGCNSNHPEVAQYNDPRHIVEVARQYPQMNIVIAHYFFPEVDYCYNITRTYPNITFDTSGLADAEVIAATGAERIRSVLLKTLQDDPKKIIFGTDYAMCTFHEHLELVNSLPIAEDVRQGILWRNAAELFTLNVI
jgi:predicted TIM-barrel fold metal-dependent hydrolase